MVEFYAYLLEKKLVTPLFVRPKDGPPLPDFNPSKKCEHHFRVEGHTLEECTQLRHRIQDLINNKLIQFDNTARPNVITNPLPPHQECYLYSERKDFRFLIPFVPLESHAMGPSPRKSHCSGQHRSSRLQLGSLLIRSQ